MKIHYWLAAAVLACTPFALQAAPAPASAPQAEGAPSVMPKSPVPEFAAADADHNGRISWSEAKALGVPKSLFERDDFDKTGYLNETEWMFIRLDMTDFAPSTKPASPATG